MSFQKHYEIFADYHQFYLMDAETHPNVPEKYTNEDIRRRIKIGKNVIVILPERNMLIPVELEILDSPPLNDFQDWQHVAEASLALPSGKMLIEECTGNEIDTLSLSPDTYRVRAYYGNLNKLSFDGLEGDDHYKITIWQAPFEEIKVLKQNENGHDSK